MPDYDEIRGELFSIATRHARRLDWQHRHIKLLRDRLEALELLVEAIMSAQEEVSTNARPQKLARPASLRGKPGPAGADRVGLDTA